MMNDQANANRRPECPGERREQEQKSPSRVDRILDGIPADLTEKRRHGLFWEIDVTSLRLLPNSSRFFKNPAIAQLLNLGAVN
jgi:hypothetical protein